MVNPMLAIEALHCGYHGRCVIGDLSFSLRGGDLLCLLGPNGVGKTTLFKTVLGLLPALGGQIRLDGKPLADWPRKRLAQYIGYVPQAHAAPFPFLVEDVVAMGRTAHLGLSGSPSRADHAIAAGALQTLGLSALARARYTEISGGQRQLVLIARALAQQPRLLVMDEPTSNLDYGNQLKVLAHVRRIVDEQGIGVMLTTHHPNHALLYGSLVLALDAQCGATLGTPHAVITEEYLRSTYGVEAELHDIVSRGGQQRRWCVPAHP